MHRGIVLTIAVVGINGVIPGLVIPVAVTASKRTRHLGMIEIAIDTKGICLIIAPTVRKIKGSTRPDWRVVVATFDSQCSIVCIKPNRRGPVPCSPAVAFFIQLIAKLGFVHRSHIVAVGSLAIGQDDDVLLPTGGGCKQFLGLVNTSLLVGAAVGVGERNRA